MLKVQGRIGWAGRVRVKVLGPGGELLGEWQGANLITAAGLDLLVSALRDNTVDAEIRYLAWGDDSTPPAAGDTALGNELGRKVVTLQEAGGTGECVTTVYLAPQDANEAIEELGWYAGPDATATPDSGILVARVLYSHTKTVLESIQVERSDTLAGA